MLLHNKVISYLFKKKLINVKLSVFIKSYFFLFYNYKFVNQCQLEHIQDLIKIVLLINGL